jgi:hypothetical protein
VWWVYELCVAFTYSSSTVGGWEGGVDRVMMGTRVFAWCSHSRLSFADSTERTTYFLRGKITKKSPPPIPSKEQIIICTYQREQTKTLNNNIIHPKTTMVKKKGKSKRVTLKDKYKMQRRVVETHRKTRKQAKGGPTRGQGRREGKGEGDGRARARAMGGQGRGRG